MAHRLGVFALLVVVAVVAFATAAVAVSSPAAAQDPQAVPTCPVPVSAIPANGSLAVCVDRGSGAVYVEGDPITICVTASIPQIAIFPPPPSPTIRLTSAVDGVSQGVIFEEAFTSDARCIDRTVQPPFGQETITAEAIGADGRVFLTDEVSFRSTPAQPQPPTERYIESALDLSAPCIPDQGQQTCSGTREALWNGVALAWALQGVTDPDARFNETVVFRVRAGDPAAIGNIAKVLGWPYLKVTRIQFAGMREWVEITNLGGGAQDLNGWTLRSPARAVVKALPAVTLAPGDRCYVFTGPPTSNPGGGCRTFVESAADVWPDEGGSIVLFAGPIDLAADDTRYSADIDNQPPPPNLQGTTVEFVDPPLVR
jgi:hypothetical protein